MLVGISTDADRHGGYQVDSSSPNEGFVSWPEEWHLALPTLPEETWEA
jgi:hypothetical protein